MIRLYTNSRLQTNDVTSEQFCLVILRFRDSIAKHSVPSGYLHNRWILK